MSLLSYPWLAEQRETKKNLSGKVLLAPRPSTSRSLQSDLLGGFRWRASNFLIQTCAACSSSCSETRRIDQHSAHHVSENRWGQWQFGGMISNIVRHKSSKKFFVIDTLKFLWEKTDIIHHVFWNDLRDKIETLLHYKTGLLITTTSAQTIIHHVFGWQGILCQKKRRKKRKKRKKSNVPLLVVVYAQVRFDDVETYGQMHLVREWRKDRPIQNVGDWDRWDGLDHMEDVFNFAAERRRWWFWLCYPLERTKLSVRPIFASGKVVVDC